MSTFLAGLLLLGVLVVVHEFGHFIVAKLFGVRVLTFSVGFGPKLIGFTYGETEYRLSAIPLGGYVRMYGEQVTEDVPEDQKKYSVLHQATWKKSLIVAAGPLFNFILPIVLFFAVYVGSQTEQLPVVGTVLQGSAAAQAGLLPGDTVKSINQKPISDFEALTKEVLNHPGQILKFEVERQKEGQPSLVTIEVTPAAQTGVDPLEPEKVFGKIGILPFVEKPHEQVASSKVLLLPLPNHIAKRFAVNEDELRSQTAQKMLLATQKAVAEEHALLLKTKGVAFAGNVIDTVMPNTPAEQLGLQSGDRIVAIDGTRTPGSLEVTRLLQESPTGIHMLGVQTKQGFVLMATRLGASPQTDTNWGLDAEQQKLVLGVQFAQAYLPGPTKVMHVGVLDAIKKAVSSTWGLMVMTVKSLWMFASFKVPASQLSGPVAIFGIAGQAAQQGAEFYVFVMALISVNLGLLNLLPIPVLDGGHLLMFGIEAVQRRPLSIKTKQIATQIGLAILLTLMVIALFNDISRVIK